MSNEEIKDPNNSEESTENVESVENAMNTEEKVPDEPVWEEPPLLEEIEVEEEPKPEMSEVATLFNIFLEPGRTFKDLALKPRFILGTVIIALLSGAFVIGIQQKLGEDRIKRNIAKQAELNPQFEAQTEEQKKANIELSYTISKVIGYAFPILLLFVFIIGSTLYFLGGAKLMGGEGSFLGAISIWVYSSFPPTVVGIILNFIVLFVVDADDIDPASTQRGLIKANPTALYDGSSTPVLTTLVSTLDLFMIWGIVLAVIGFKKSIQTYRQVVLWRL